MRYDEFAENGLDDEKWGEQHDKQILDFLPNLFYKIEADNFNKFPVPIYVLKYNEFSVINRKNDNTREDYER